MMVEAFHGESIARFGGTDGIRDEGLLESALAKPQNQFSYRPEATVFELAAAYGIGIVGNHPFVDGNKRAGLLAAQVFLALNGYRLEPEEAEIVHIIVGLAAGEVDESELANWLQDNSKPNR
jgi:death-on-curing protein